jgi:LuxR family maltose regulon positive regulatory protein
LPLAWLRQMQGDAAAAQTLWRRALNVVRQAESKRVEAQLRMHQARLDLARAGASPADKLGLEAAGEWARSYRQSQPDPRSYPQALPLMTCAWVELAQGRPGQALDSLKSLAEAAAAGGWVDNMIKILTLQALAYAARGDSEPALRALSRALDLAAPEGYVRSFVDWGPPMHGLLQRAAAAGIAPDYVGPLLAAFPEGTPPPSPAAPQPLIEPLTERELAILRLMAANLSHRQIGQELYLSVNTIKWHSTHIYSKLGVHRRADAIARARELDML